MQLVYTHWYPEHPALKKNDAEHGKPEGVTLRLTLDADHRPALMETVYNCGCYHRLYPSECLEAEARAEEALVRTHVKHALNFIHILEDQFPPTRAVSLYLEQLEVPSSRARAIYQRTLARVAAGRAG